MEFPMLDRRWFGDLGLAILLTLPIASLTLPLPVSGQSDAAPVVAKAPTANRIAATGRISLLG
jgi:hypothetical protein